MSLFTDQQARLKKKRWMSNYAQLMDIATQGAMVPDDLPFPVTDLYQSSEKVVVVPNLYKLTLERDIRAFNRKSCSAITGNTIVIEEHDRPEAEFLDTDYQVIVACIIHTKDTMMLLELTNIAPIINRYVKGTLTMVQGHMTLDYHYDGRHIVTFGDFIELASRNMARELKEEVSLKHGTKEQKEAFANALDYATISLDTEISSIYYDIEGSIWRHLCICFDIDADCAPALSTAFRERNIISKEPEKHKVRFIQFQDLLEMRSMDMVCDWLKGALRQSHWFHDFCKK